jgi:hypothetical protein
VEEDDRSTLTVFDVGHPPTIDLDTLLLDHRRSSVFDCWMMSAD